MPADFSLEGYGRLVRELLERGYEVRGFADAEPERRHLVLRHDVDLSVEAAVTLAEAEAELGLASTYFALVRSELYNALSPSGRAGLRRILELGHAVGLHFDASLYPDEPAALEAGCAEECAALELVLGRGVETVSFHRPAPSLLGHPEPLAGRRHAYQPRFFREMGYCSDSRGAWHHGPPLEHQAVATGRGLQLLTHPIWWVGAAGASPAERLEALAVSRGERFRDELAAHCEPYREARESREAGEARAGGARRPRG